MEAYKNMSELFQDIELDIKMLKEKFKDQPIALKVIEEWEALRKQMDENNGVKKDLKKSKG